MFKAQDTFKFHKTDILRDINDTLNYAVECSRLKIRLNSTILIFTRY